MSALTPRAKPVSADCFQPAMPSGRSPAKREPIARSQAPAATGSSSSGRSAGSTWPSESMCAIRSKSRARTHSTPVRNAAPTPRFTGWLTTSAPAARATSAVASFEPSSITSTVGAPVDSPDSARSSPTRSPMWSASLSAGKRTHAFTRREIPRGGPRRQSMPTPAGRAVTGVTLGR
jgi:hypothetical protein